MTDEVSLFSKPRNIPTLMFVDLFHNSKKERKKEKMSRNIRFFLSLNNDLSEGGRGRENYEEADSGCAFDCLME